MVIFSKDHITTFSGSHQTVSYKKEKLCMYVYVRHLLPVTTIHFITFKLCKHNAEDPRNCNVEFVFG